MVKEENIFCVTKLENRLIKPPHGSDGLSESKFDSKHITGLSSGIIITDFLEHNYMALCTNVNSLRSYVQLYKSHNAEKKHKLHSYKDSQN